MTSSRAPHIPLSRALPSFSRALLPLSDSLSLAFRSPPPPLLLPSSLLGLSLSLSLPRSPRLAAWLRSLERSSEAG